MKCPWCGGEMEEGFIESSHTIYFTKKPHKLIYRPSKTDDIALTRIFKPYCKSWNCSYCNRMVIDNLDE